MKSLFTIDLIGAQCCQSWQGKVHSTFENAVNIETNDNKLYTVLYNPLWIAETSIIIDKTASPLLKEAHFFSCDGQFLSYDGKILADLSQSFIWQMPDVKGHKLSFDLPVLADRLAEIPGNEIISYISKIFTESAEKFIQNVDSGFENIIGAGQGLTPSGDDMLTGFALALLCKAPERLNELARRCTPLLNNTTDISKHLLLNAFEGKFNAPLLNVLLSTDQNIRTHLETALNIGSSSGRDGVFGLYTGLKLLS